MCCVVYLSSYSDSNRSNCLQLLLLHPARNSARVAKNKRHNYQPQRSCGQGYVFTCVCDSVHRPQGGFSKQDPPPPPPTPAGRNGPLPRTRQTPPGPGRHPPGPSRHPQDQADTPQTRQTPPGEEDCSMRSMSGRYASYWNAFLFH